ncbi:MAG: hypothetical protein ACRD1K_04910 [Acidimicrobiales bacterium]
MNARRLGWTFGAATLAGAGAYLLIYLYRWEWNRALTAGVFVLIAEVALVGAAVLERLGGMEQRLAASVPVAAPAGTDRALRVLRDTAPPPRDHFAWLAPRTDQLGVFVPVMMGAGALLSGLAWLVERLARRTARPLLEQKLAHRLGALSLPEGGLVGPAPTAVAAGSATARLLAPGAGALR